MSDRTDRQCEATNRRGEPCQAPPLKGGRWCAAHDPSKPFGTSEFAHITGPLGGRPRVPRPTEIARRLVEGNVAALLRPHLLTLGYDVDVGDDGPRLVRDAAAQGDAPEMAHASRELLDRVYGPVAVS